MKTALITGLFAAFFISSAHATFVKQTPPSKNEGSSLDDIISSYSQKALLQAMKGKGFNYKVPDVPKGCLVSLPDKNNTTPRVARVASRMSAWIGEQTPDKQLPRVYLHREGDRHVFLVGPAENVNDSMGDKPDLIIRQRETESGNPKDEGVLGVVDHSDEVHYIPLTNMNTIGAGLKAFEDGPLDGDRIGKMQFRVKNARPTVDLLGNTSKNSDSYTVTALFIKFGGAVRVFGLCM